MLGKDLVRVHIVGKDSEWDFLLKHLNASASHSNFVVANKNKIWMTPTATGQTFKWKDSVVTSCTGMIQSLLERAQASLSGVHQWNASTCRCCIRPSKTCAVDFNNGSGKTNEKKKSIKFSQRYFRHRCCQALSSFSVPFTFWQRAPECQHSSHQCSSIAFCVKQWLS